MTGKSVAQEVVTDCCFIVEDVYYLVALSLRSQPYGGGCVREKIPLPLLLQISAMGAVGKAERSQCPLSCTINNGTTGNVFHQVKQHIVAQLIPFIQ